MRSVQTYLQELKFTTDPKTVKELVKIHAPLMKAMKIVIKKTEAAITTKLKPMNLPK